MLKARYYKAGEVLQKDIEPDNNVFLTVSPPILDSSGGSPLQNDIPSSANKPICCCAVSKSGVRCRNKEKKMHGGHLYCRLHIYSRH